MLEREKKRLQEMEYEERIRKSRSNRWNKIVREEKIPMYLEKEWKEKRRVIRPGWESK